MEHICFSKAREDIGFNKACFKRKLDKLSLLMVQIIANLRSIFNIPLDVSKTNEELRPNHSSKAISPRLKRGLLSKGAEEIYFLSHIPEAVPDLMLIVLFYKKVKRLKPIKLDSRSLSRRT